jgi:hypothetical protein
MALYDTRFGLPQIMVDYLNQGFLVYNNLQPGYDQIMDQKVWVIPQSCPT